MGGAIRGKITTLKDVWGIRFYELPYPGNAQTDPSKLPAIQRKWVYGFNEVGNCVYKIYPRLSNEWYSFKPAYRRKRVGTSHFSKHARLIPYANFRPDDSLLHQDMFFYLSPVELGEAAVKAVETAIRAEANKRGSKTPQDHFDACVDAANAAEKKKLQKNPGASLGLKSVVWLDQGRGFTCTRVRFDLTYKKAKALKKNEWKHCIVLRDPLKWAEDCHRYGFVGALRYMILHRDHPGRLHRRFTAHAMAYEINARDVAGKVDKKSLSPCLTSVGTAFQVKNPDAIRKVSGWDPASLFGNKLHSRGRKWRYQHPRVVVDEIYGGVERQYARVPVADWNRVIQKPPSSWKGFYPMRQTNAAALFVALDDLRMKALIQNCHRKVEKLRRIVFSPFYQPMECELVDLASSLSSRSKSTWQKDGIEEKNIERLLLHISSIMYRLYESPSGTLLCFDWKRKKKSLIPTLGKHIENPLEKKTGKLDFFFYNVIKGGLSPFIDVTALTLTQTFSVVPSGTGQRPSRSNLVARHKAYRGWLGSSRIAHRQQELQRAVGQASQTWGHDVGESFKAKTTGLMTTISVVDYGLSMMRLLDRAMKPGKSPTATQDILDISRGGGLAVGFLAQRRPDWLITRAGTAVTKCFGMFGAVYGLMMAFQTLRTAATANAGVRAGVTLKTSVTAFSFVGGLALSSMSMGAGVACYAACYLLSLLGDYIIDVYSWAEWQTAAENSFLGKKHNGKPLSRSQLIQSQREWIALYSRFKLDIRHEHLAGRHYVRLAFSPPHTAHEKAMLQIDWLHEPPRNSPSQAARQRYGALADRSYSATVHNVKQPASGQVVIKQQGGGRITHRIYTRGTRHEYCFDVPAGFLANDSLVGSHQIEVRYIDPRYKASQPFDPVKLEGARTGGKLVEPVKARIKIFNGGM